MKLYRCFGLCVAIVWMCFHYMHKGESSTKSCYCQDWPHPPLWLHKWQEYYSSAVGANSHTLCAWAQCFFFEGPGQAPMSRTGEVWQSSSLFSTLHKLLKDYSRRLLKRVKQQQSQTTGTKAHLEMEHGSETKCIQCFHILHPKDKLLYWSALW